MKHLAYFLLTVALLSCGNAQTVTALSNPKLLTNLDANGQDILKIDELKFGPSNDVSISRTGNGTIGLTGNTSLSGTLEVYGASQFYSGLTLSDSDLVLNGNAQLNGSLFVGGLTLTSTELGYLDGVTSNIQTQLSSKQPSDSDLTALASNTDTGLWAVTGSGAGSVRTIAGTSNQITVTNGTGVSGNPTIAISNDPTLPGNVTVSGGTLKGPSSGDLLLQANPAGSGNGALIGYAGSAAGENQFQIFPSTHQFFPNQFTLKLAGQEKLTVTETKAVNYGKLHFDANGTSLLSFGTKNDQEFRIFENPGGVNAFGMGYDSAQGRLYLKANDSKFLEGFAGGVIVNGDFTASGGMNIRRPAINFLDFAPSDDVPNYWRFYWTSNTYSPSDNRKFHFSYNGVDKMVVSTSGDVSAANSLASGSGGVTTSGNINASGTGTNTLTGATTVSGVLTSNSGRVIRADVVTANTTLNATHNLVVANSDSNITITLPPANTNAGREYRIKNKNTGAVTVIVTGGGYMDSSTSINLVRWTSITFISDGTTWGLY